MAGYTALAVGVGLKDIAFGGGDVKVRNGIREGRCGEIGLGGNLNAVSGAIQHPEIPQAGVGSGLLCTDISHVVLVRNFLTIPAKEAGAAAVYVVLPGAKAKEVKVPVSAGHCEGHTKAEHVRSVRGIAHLLHHGDGAIGTDLVEDGERGLPAYGLVVNLNQGTAAFSGNVDGRYLELRIPPEIPAVREGGAKVVLHGRAVEARHQRLGKEFLPADDVRSDGAGGFVESDGPGGTAHHHGLAAL